MGDLLQMAKQLKVDLFGVHGEYLKNMYNKDFFHKCQMQKRYKLLKKAIPSLCCAMIKGDEPEPKLMAINKSSIKKMMSHKSLKPLDRTLLVRIISECGIVKKLNVHITVVECIVMFARSMPLPISYSILYLPNFRAFCAHKTYTATLKE